MGLVGRQGFGGGTVGNVEQQGAAGHRLAAIGQQRAAGDDHATVPVQIVLMGLAQRRPQVLATGHIGAPMRIGAAMVLSEHFCQKVLQRLP